MRNHVITLQIIMSCHPKQHHDLTSVLSDNTPHGGLCDGSKRIANLTHHVSAFVLRTSFRKYASVKAYTGSILCGFES